MNKRGYLKRYLEKKQIKLKMDLFYRLNVELSDECHCMTLAHLKTV